MSTRREQPWSDEPPAPGRVVVVSDNPVGRAVVAIADVVGRPTTLLLDEGVDPSPLTWLADNPLGPGDALVLCDHDAPQATDLLVAALTGEAGYVAMLGSRRRAASLRDDLQHRLPADRLARLHVPAGLDIGGRAPGEMALSVVAELVAASYGRAGGSMRPR